MQNRSLSDRFWAKVDKSGNCWIWKGALMPQGYGGFYLDSTRRRGYAHRASWEITNGQIPPGMSILHSCDNRKCVNPSHLRIGTQRDNVYDMLSKGRFNGRFKNIQIGTDNPASVLCNEDIAAIRACYCTGRFGYRRLGSMFGVTPIAIKKIILRQTWKHVA